MGIDCQVLDRTKGKLGVRPGEGTGPTPEEWEAVMAMRRAALPVEPPGGDGEETP